MIAFYISGCQSVSFNVIRPARINVVGMTPSGRDATVSVGRWQTVSSQGINNLLGKLSQAISDSPRHLVKLDVNRQGIVILEGELNTYDYSQQMTRQSQTCTRYTLGSKKAEKYACTAYSLKGVASIRVIMRVLDSQGHVIGGDSFKNSATGYSSNIDQEPEPIDYMSMLDELENQAVQHLAKLVVPYREKVEKDWLSCGKIDDHCERALKALKSENFEAAQEDLFEGIKKLENDADASKDLAAAWWALALTQEFSGDFNNAKASLKEAIKHNPDEDLFHDEVRSIKKEEDNAKKLAKQGLAD